MPKKKDLSPSATSVQLVVRVADHLDRDLRTAAELLGVDVSNLVRMILTEHVPDYLARGIDAKKRATAARLEVLGRPSTPATGAADQPPVKEQTDRPEDGRPGLDL